jgi:hypothetical protein
VFSTSLLLLGSSGTFVDGSHYYNQLFVETAERKRTKQFTKKDAGFLLLIWFLFSLICSEQQHLFALLILLQCNQLVIFEDDDYLCKAASNVKEEK